MAQPHNLAAPGDHSPYSSHSGGSSMNSIGRQTGGSFDSHSSRHVFVQEVGGGSYQDRTPPSSHVGQPMAQSQTARLPAGSSSIKYPPSMMQQKWVREGQNCVTVCPCVCVCVCVCVNLCAVCHWGWVTLIYISVVIVLHCLGEGGSTDLCISSG